MRFATVKLENQETAAIIHDGQVYLIIDINNHFNQSFATNLFDMINTQQIPSIQKWYKSEGKDNITQVQGTPIEDVTFGPLYRHPSKIWGIGLNYVEHAADLNEVAPNTEPASFMKPDTTIIGHGDHIEIPHQSNRTTAEAELGLIIGQTCKNVKEDEALNYVVGYTTIIDMTAEDILEKNPRYLTRAKSFDTFFSFGPVLVTTDEIEDLHQVEVATYINDELHRKNVVSNMTFKPEYLVSFHSKVMTLKPGDIISTGTPGAVKISDGDTVECRIEGFTTLKNSVVDLKNK